MNWLIRFFTSSIGKKVIMSLTGIFLCLFLVVHMAGNMLLLLDDGGEAYNKYAYGMATNPIIQFISIGNFFFILLHAFQGLYLTYQNKKARPVAYAMSKSAKSGTWSSRNMGILGSFILLFIVVHLKSFWFEMKFGSVPYITYDGAQFKDLFTIVSAAFSQWWYVLFYVFSLTVLSFHLQHGFHSAFQTLGINQKKYTPIIKGVGVAFSILILLGFSLQPIVLFIRSLG